MTFTQRCAAALLLLGSVAVCQAQVPARVDSAVRPATPAALAKTAPAPLPAASAPQRNDAQSQHTMIEDDGVRIEETRLRGAAKRIVVHSKVGGVREYEIQVAPAGRDPAQERGGAGQRAWSLFSF